MKHVIYLGLVSLNFSALGQVIEVPAGTPLTVQGNLNLPTGSALHFNNQPFLKAPAVGSNNTYLGIEAGNSGSGGGNTFLGYQTGRNNTSGVANVFVGSQAGLNNTTGTGNLFLGQLAGAANTGGNYNLFMGNSSGQATSSGSGNTAIGDGSGLHNTTGQRNVSIGQYAGLNNQTGSDNVFIGYGAKAGTANPTNLSNAVAIGANAVVSQNNSLVLGNNVNVGIGNSAPSAKLHVTAGSNNASGLRLEKLTSGSPATALNQTKFLTVDASGNVILGSTNSSGRVAAEDALWQRNGRFLESTNGEAVIVGQGVRKTPAGYSLFVGQGLLAEKVKVALKDTDEWSDKVFEAGYPLKSLRVIEQYIKANGHLPGIPSANQMVEQGNDLQKTDAMLLEKIEELTLHMIRLEKRMNQVKRENQRLRRELKQVHPTKGN